MKRNLFSSNPDLADRGGYYLLIGLIGLALVVIDQSTDWIQTTKNRLVEASSLVAITSLETRKLVRNQYRMMDSHTQLLNHINKLERQNSALSSTVALLTPLREENLQLRELLNISKKQSGSLQLAEVINIPYNPFDQWLLINKGSEDGVFVGQQVITSKGVVGQIYQLYENTSKVLVITDISHSLPVELVASKSYLLADGSGNNGQLVIRTVNNSIRVRDNEEIVTSGLGGIFSAGQAVGKVVESHFDVNTDTYLIFIRPHVRINNLRHVFLIFPVLEDT